MFCYIYGLIIDKIRKLNNYCQKNYLKKKFSKLGKNVYIGNNCKFTYENIEINDNVYIGQNCIFQTTFGRIVIGKNVMFGPGVNIHCGNHIINQVGKYMIDVNNKNPGDDGTIIIEDDCWIGANSIILNNVVIGKGSVIGAGSIVTHNVNEYSVYTGAPALKIRSRFNPDDLKKHIDLINNK